MQSGFSPSSAAVAAGLLLLLGGCAVAPSVPPQASLTAVTPAVLNRLGPQAGLADAPVPARWWELLGDDTLSGLEAEAAAANLDLQSAMLRVDQSRARLGLAEAARQPTVSAEAGVNRSALSQNSPWVKIGASSEPYNTWSAGLQASWELDLWGYLQHRSDGAAARVEVAAYEREGVRVSVAAEVARSYVLLRGVQAQMEILDTNQQVASDLVRMTESRERNGVATRFDAAAARADLAGIQARLAQVRHQRDVWMNALALLLAKPPHELDSRLTAAVALPMPAALPVGVPSDLARRRPDIQRAEAQLRAAVADIGAAEADFYPRIRLTGRFGASGFGANELGDWASREFAIGPTIHLPIFEGGALHRNLELSQTAHRLAAVAYQQTVLKAWHEVDDALGAYATERERHEHLTEAVARNQVALDVAQRGYQQGSADFTAVLVARRTLLVSQAELNDCTTATALSVVSLYRALGGGWSDELGAGLQPTRAAT
ncbi:efflux transporter, outer membrane factor (OMF) lipoprotein, NodT family [Roseateles sp. YR242]|uniref:efflux transporter outer membrane subunit n=1 Tax=Roseateles sp. YR242 TaxID=1855305 RepID=UPI0008AB9E20|nr:efflux transporter outer membrane subunit [Roseateles sp. YR242]SEL39001.1 efflux transporter, outer membrane factor (OMF) lipoprotein, NodT family [Roseateles sp. YR242]